MGKGQRPYGCNPDAPHGDGVGTPVCQGQIRLRDDKGDICQPSPQYGMGLLKNILEEAREAFLWQKAALHRHGEGMEGGLI
eukprot:7267055-Karenia_brevis.AAC.1